MGKSYSSDLRQRVVNAVERSFRFTTESGHPRTVWEYPSCANSGIGIARCLLQPCTVTVDRFPRGSSAFGAALTD